MTYSIDIHLYERTEPRLGRHVAHDSRNRAYAIRDTPIYASGKPLDIQWSSKLPISDQGGVGACTGFSVLDILGYASYWNSLTRATQVYLETNPTQAGLLFYHTATVLDAIPGQYLPNDTGSDGPSAAKAGVKLGYFSGYTHAFSPQAFDAALQLGPVMVGTRWDNSMMRPNASGVIIPDKSSGVAGGHEYLIDGYSAAKDAYRLRNHWSTGWGLNGVAWIPRQPFYELLDDQGDVTVPYPLGSAPPSPTPPAPVVDKVDKDVVGAYKALQAWAKRNYVS